MTVMETERLRLHEMDPAWIPAAYDIQVIFDDQISKEAALSDPELTNFYCPACGANVTCVGFVKQNAEKFVCIGKCENGEELFVRFKFTKWTDGKYSVSRILYEMDAEKKSYYLAKKQYAAEAAAAYLQSLSAEQS